MQVLVLFATRFGFFNLENVVIKIELFIGNYAFHHLSC